LKFTLQESSVIDPLIGPVNELQFLLPERLFLNQPIEEDYVAGSFLHFGEGM
jgi:hypothetical protein